MGDLRETWNVFETGDILLTRSILEARTPGRDAPVKVLVAELYVSPSLVQHLVLLRLLKVPVGELLVGDGPVFRWNIDLGEEKFDAVDDVEFVFVVNVVFGIHEILPLRLGLGGRGTADGSEVIPHPLTNTVNDLDFGYDRVERDAMVVTSGENNGSGSELQATVREVLAASAEGMEEEEQ